MYKKYQCSNLIQIINTLINILIPRFSTEGGTNLPMSDDKQVFLFVFSSYKIYAEEDGRLISIPMIDYFFKIKRVQKTVSIFFMQILEESTTTYTYISMCSVHQSSQFIKIIKFQLGILGSPLTIDGFYFTHEIGKLELCYKYIDRSSCLSELVLNILRMLFISNDV